MNNEIAIRIGFSLGLFILMAAWEGLAPRRRPRMSRRVRWPHNLALSLFNVVIVWLVSPLTPVGMALLARRQGWGLLNGWNLPDWLSLALGIVLLDLAIYLQHVLFHAVPTLWRLHRVHHADLDLDVTTGLRFHPLEIVLSLGLKVTVIAALGPPVAAVVLFVVLLNGVSMFNHGNVRIPPGIDRRLRWLVVTPDMHRVHHSVIPSETNSNFGFNLPWWDRLLGTYRAQPSEGHLGMTIGLRRFLDAGRQTIGWLLWLPFAGRPADHPVGRREGDRSSSAGRRSRNEKKG